MRSLPTGGQKTTKICSGAMGPKHSDNSNTCLMPACPQNCGMEHDGPLRQILRSVNGVRRAVVNCVWLAEARWRGLELGGGVVLNGRPYLHRHPGSRIVVGAGVCLNSSLRSNPIGCSRPVSLRTMQAGAEIVLGPGAGLSSTSICAAKRVEIGEGTFVGADVVIFDNDFHAPVGESGWGDFAPDNPRPVVIGRGVFIGTHAIILKGVSIGDRAIVGAGAVVTRNVPAKHIAVGNPARIIPR